MKSENCIVQLRLCSAFNDVCSNSDEWIEFIDDNKMFFVHDDNNTGISELLPKKTSDCLVVHNETEDSCALLKIDMGLFKKKGTRCDCAILSIETLYLNEFKANCTSKNSKTIIGRYEKAMSQLAASYEFMKGKIEKNGVNLLEKVKVKANVLVPESYPKISSTVMAFRIEFYEKNKIPLSFEKEINI